MKFCYSLGEDVSKPGNVRPVEGSLSALVAQKPHVLPYTRARFKQLPQEDQKRLKHSMPYFVPAVLPKGVRKNGAVHARTLIVLDIEAPRAADGQPPQPQDVAAAMDMLGIAGWVYTTLNHTPSKPRYRVVLVPPGPLSGPDMKAKHKELGLDFARVVGIREHFVDGASWNLSIPMFLPAKYKGGEYWSSGAMGGVPWSISNPKPSKKPEQPQHADPIVVGLQQAGLSPREDPDQPGKWYFRCPFADQHGTVNDSQTVYYESGSRNPADPLGPRNSAVVCFDTAPDVDGKPHLTLTSLKAWLREQLGDKFHSYEKLADFPDMRSSGRIDLPRLAVQSASQFLNHVPPPSLVNGLIPGGSAAVMIQGQSGVGKSFFVIDLALHLSMGMPWNSLKVPRALRVGIIVAEGASGARQRVRAWCKRHGIRPEQLRILFIDDAPNIASEPDCVRISQHTMDATEGEGLDLLFIDTLARVTAGLNENSSEMSVALRHLAGMHRATGATQVLVHHLGKDVERGGRGWSGIKADMDTVIEVTKGAGDMRHVRVDKQRDGAEGMRWDFKLVPVPVGHDEDGAEVMSAVVEYSEFAEPDAGPRLKVNEAALLDAMQTVLDRGEPLTLKAVKAAFVEVKHRRDPTLVKRALDQQVLKLLPALCARSDNDFEYDEVTGTITVACTNA